MPTPAPGHLCAHCVCREVSVLLCTWPVAAPCPSPLQNGQDRTRGACGNMRGTPQAWEESNCTMLLVDGGPPIDVISHARVWGEERREGGRRVSRCAVWPLLCCLRQQLSHSQGDGRPKPTQAPPAGTALHPQGKGREEARAGTKQSLKATQG